ncbi:hypothetical protein F442_02695 [Phytophthora nicotianae P10297]|uniref:Crinkler effector protein N-terminal domain-containing protein n=4 Tax=Phytophthora nicotianae TaxID=4792 RepID=W2PCA9_PHYN3|nr:hypothetical protein PPTG_24569 [Phytophthora nicotianae INRA-310]ETI54473.1 hypothetical protein F443_02730 [Phytophthora nicotianae P1569]ETM98697.1 hypothetical protein PPTG_24569 [Phytophthora nicotianae INRA-310]ETO83223.1 hypothetical protein F444_02730 [Phytophthora nicotianae P1976]ETP52286.1 hypothetical protein F442_02695 [Phytophthora nicotianae P10297]
MQRLLEAGISVRVDKSDLVDDLKKAIKAEEKDKLKNVDTNDLQL